MARLQFFPTISAVALLISFAHQASAAAQIDENLGRAGVLACQANLESFQTYKCHFTIVLANADSREDALKGSYRNAKRYDHVIVVDNGKEKLETLGLGADLNISKDQIKTTDKFAYASFDFLPQAHLRLGEDAFEYTKSLRTADLHSKDNPPRITGFLPLSIGMFGPRFSTAPWTMMTLKDEAIVTLATASQEILEGQPTLLVAFAHKGKVRRKYFLDVQRGYLPIQVVYYQPPECDRVAQHALVLETKEFEKNRWFPMHTVILMSPAKTETRLVDIRVTDLVVDVRPDEMDFSLKVHGGTRIRDMSHHDGSGFYLKADEDIKATDIPRLFTMVAESKHNRQMETGLRKKDWHMARIGVFCGATAFVFFSFLLWRVYRRKEVSSS